MSWLQDLAARSVLEVAPHFDIQVFDRGRHLGPCPECHELTRSRTDSRPGPIFLVGGGRGWACGRCNAKGSVIDLISLSLFGERLPARDPRWSELRQRVAELGLGEAPPLPDDPTPVPIARQRIPAHELEALWERCGPVDLDPECSAWLVRRGLDPAVCAERNLCRALPRGPVPPWAIFRGAPWHMGWRCIMQAFGPDGRVASLRARWVHETAPPDGGEKTGAAAGGPGSAGGAVLACGLGRQVLESGTVPEWWPARELFDVVVSEGEPDWLTWASRPEAPAVLGLFSGAWDETIAERVPAHARVLVRTHDDEAGHRYGRKVVASLWHRCVVFGLPALQEES